MLYNLDFFLLHHADIWAKECSQKSKGNLHFSGFNSHYASTLALKANHTDRGGIKVHRDPPWNKLNCVSALPFVRCKKYFFSLSLSLSLTLSFLFYSDYIYSHFHRHPLTTTLRPPVCEWEKKRKPLFKVGGMDGKWVDGWRRNGRGLLLAGWQMRGISLPPKCVVSMGAASVHCGVLSLSVGRVTSW